MTTTLGYRDMSPRRLILPLVAAGALCGVAPAATAEPILAVTTDNALLQFDSATAGTTSFVAVSGTGGEQILGIDYRPATGQLYGLGSANNLYLIDAASGSATLAGMLGTPLSGTSFGVDFNPTVDRLRVTSGADQNLRINAAAPAGAGTIVDGTLAYAAGDVNAGRNPSVAGSAYTNNIAGATTTALFGIDSALDVLVRQNPANDGTLATVGALGLNAGSMLGFDISGRSGIAYAAWSTGEGPSSLYTVDLGTGSASLLGQIGTPGQQVRGIAAPVSVPEPTLTALLGVGVALLTARGRRRAAGRG